MDSINIFSNIFLQTQGGRLNFGLLSLRYLSAKRNNFFTLHYPTLTIYQDTWGVIHTYESYIYRSYTQCVLVYN
jgi:hypothetical protein